MDEKVKRRWIDALRSGEYKQAQGILRNMYQGFCCLGVLCDLHAKDTGENWHPAGPYLEYRQCKTSLPPEVFHWAGMKESTAYSTETGEGVSNKRLQNLVKMNDAGIDFTEIADYIERNL